MLSPIPIAPRPRSIGSPFPNTRVSNGNRPASRDPISNAFPTTLTVDPIFPSRYSLDSGSLAVRHVRIFLPLTVERCRGIRYRSVERSRFHSLFRSFSTLCHPSGSRSDPEHWFFIHKLSSLRRHHRPAINTPPTIEDRLALIHLKCRSLALCDPSHLIQTRCPQPRTSSLQASISFTSHHGRAIPFTRLCLLPQSQRKWIRTSKGTTAATFTNFTRPLADCSQSEHDQMFGLWQIGRPARTRRAHLSAPQPGRK